MDNEFICPECGSKKAGMQSMVSRPTPTRGNEDPWASILQDIECLSCKKIIPAHLAERWDDISIEEAKKEWRDQKKKTSHLQQRD